MRLRRRAISVAATSPVSAAAATAQIDACTTSWRKIASDGPYGGLGAYATSTAAPLRRSSGSATRVERPPWNAAT